MTEDDNRFIGCMGVGGPLPTHRKCELGYWIGRPYWGKGYATEAARRVLQCAFQGLGANKVFAQYFSRNPASGKVMAKIGMTYEGTKRQDLMKWGAFEDVAIYSILRSEFESQ